MRTIGKLGAAHSARLLGKELMIDDLEGLLSSGASDSRFGAVVTVVVLAGGSVTTVRSYTRRTFVIGAIGNGSSRKRQFVI